MPILRRSKIGDLLLNNKLITQDQLDTALREAGGKGEQALARAIINLGFVPPEKLLQALSDHLGIPAIDLKEAHIDPQVPHMLSEEFLRQNNVIPIDITDDAIHVAFFPPVDPAVFDEVELVTGYRVKPLIASERDIYYTLNLYFSTKHRTHQTIVDMHVEEQAPLIGEGPVLDEVVEAAKAPPVVRLVMDIIDGAIHERASDIHLEPQEGEMRVRYRIDGILHDVMHIPPQIEPPVISRIKILANLDITERRIPQDGHITIKKGGKDYDIRVSTFPTVNGEKIVLRLLSKETMLMELEELGLNAHDLNILKTLTAKPYGMILVTGPTGSGKTTTLYSILSRLNSREENIVTIEDPVEYKLPGINQSQINPNIGVNFATGLRSMLRQDPNIIMVGEIRDPETAAIAVQAALTGHLVFTTLHTNDAPSAVTRLLDMEVKPFLISASVIGVIAQRLVRVVCQTCKESYHADVGELGRDFGFATTKSGKVSLWRGRGCKYCGNTGYHGRTGIFEVMPITEEIRHLIIRGETANVIRRVAIQQGMSTLRHSALRKIVDGQTSLDEVRRAVFLGVE
ncbi:MAG: GspE/PulE family protein [bacterium]